MNVTKLLGSLQQKTKGMKRHSRNVQYHSGLRGLEWLENRMLLANQPLVVTSVHDFHDVDHGDGVCEDRTGRCTLRAAIEESNAHPGPDQIRFAILAPRSRPAVIRPGSGPRNLGPLPTIDDPVVIDGYTQSFAQPNTNPTGQGFNNVMRVVVDGSLTEGANGLTIVSQDVTVRGLVINNFQGHGIALFGPGSGVIEGNFIGTDHSGTMDRGNGGDGVHIVGSSNNRVGGTEPASSNLISGNDDDGVEIQDFVVLARPAQRNTDIILHVPTTDNGVQGNFIGTDRTGSVALGNSYDGVFLFGIQDSGVRNNTIGGSTAAARNLISGNGTALDEVRGSGVHLVGRSFQDGINTTVDNHISGNFIGTDVTGKTDLGNAQDGVRIDGAVQTTVGGLTVRPGTGLGNVISGNDVHGVSIRDICIREEDFFHLERSFMDGGSGGYIPRVGDSNLDGRFDSSDLIRALQAGTSENDGPAGWEEGDWNGDGEFTSSDFVVAFLDGGYEDGTTDIPLQILHENPGLARKVDERINLSHSPCAPGRNFVQGNLIGTDVTGTGRLANAVDGVFVLGSPHNLIGGPTQAARNVISANGQDGVEIDGDIETSGDPTAVNNIVAANSIGTQIDDSTPLGNGSHGVLLSNFASFNTVGRANTIAFNGEEGVSVSGTNNKTDSNTIRENGGHGVEILKGVGNTITANNIFNNAALGINLFASNDPPTEVTPNDQGDHDGGANSLQNFPNVAIHAANQLAMELDSFPNLFYRIEIFANRTCDPLAGEGEQFIASLIVQTDDSGFVRLSDKQMSLITSFPTDMFLTATATNLPTGDTSEFSGCS